MDENFSLFTYNKEDKLRILKSLDFTESGMQEDVENIMEWFQKQPHLVEAGIDPDIVEKLLIMSKGSCEKVKRRIDNLYKYKALSPDFIESRKEILSSDGDFFTFYRQAVMTKRFDDKRITVLKFQDPDPSTFSLEEIFRNSFIFGDLRTKFDFFLGEIWVIDLKNISLGHLLRLNPMVVHRASQLFQEGLSFKVFSIHILNAPSVGLQLLNFFKRFVKAKIMDRLMVHENLEELHKEIPKEYLPKDYGGYDLSMDEFKEKYQKEFRTERTTQYLLKACSYISNEKKRSNGSDYGESMAGTFKKLDLD